MKLLCANVDPAFGDASKLSDTLQVCYEVLILEHLETDFGDDHKETDPHIVRLGWSMDKTSFQLGTLVHFVSIYLCLIVKVFRILSFLINNELGMPYSCLIEIISSRCTP